MCIAIYKPKGQAVPSEEILRKSFEHNPDGCGYMLPYKGKVEIRKGFSTYEEFIDDYVNFVLGNGIDVTKIPMVFHFRISTQGGVKPELTHPYPLTDNYGDMRKLNVRCNVGIVHNGIIPLTSENEYSGGHWDKKHNTWVYDRKVTLDHNDTMKFIKDVIIPLSDGDVRWSYRKSKLDLINLLADGSRLAIMHRNGWVNLIGDWHERDGIYYSNLGIFDDFSRLGGVAKRWWDDDDNWYTGYGGSDECKGI